MDQATRQEFLHLTTPEVVLFYTLVFSSLAYACWRFWQRSREWKAAKALETTKKPFGEMLRDVTTYILAQRKVRKSRKSSGALMHLLLFYGFLSLLLATTLLAIATYAHKFGLPNFHQGTYFLWFEAIFDVLGLLFILGMAWAWERRLRVFITTKRQPIGGDRTDLIGVSVLFLAGITGYLLEAARIAVAPQDADPWSVVAYRMAPLFHGLSADGYRGVWWFHMIWVLAFFVMLPHFRLRHMVVGTLNAAAFPDPPMGRLVPISMEEVEQTGQIGVAKAAEFSRYGLMTLDACMECGRCTEVCPAWNAGKVLNPRQVVQNIRGAIGTDNLISDVIGEEALWACTTCNACVEACPVLIRHVDLIVDARRHVVAEGKLSGSGAVVLRQTGSTGNAWGAPRQSREDWMKDLEIQLCRDGQPFEYLFWVGCAGATDPSAIKTTKAMASLLKKAGISFACLGQEEACTGDPARRIGDEFLFQEKAMENVSTFQKYNVKKVVTACPHCFNTLKNEYGDFEAQIEVWHHTQLLATLVQEGKLKAGSSSNTVLHDPCYLGRVNNISDAPRTLLGEKTNYETNPPDAVGSFPSRPHELKEPSFCATKTRCCGAGGGRMWMEEPPDQRPGNKRAEELLATGAKTVAVGCPFCRIMLDASIKQVTEEEIRLLDLAEILAEANA